MSNPQHQHSQTGKHPGQDTRNRAKWNRKTDPDRRRERDRR